MLGAPSDFCIIGSLPSVTTNSLDLYLPYWQLLADEFNKRREGTQGSAKR